MSANTDAELWLPALCINIAVGRSLVAKGLLTKEEIRLELLKMTKASDDNPAIEKALHDAVTSVAGW